jgi:gliding motility-associated transport system permease protein
MATKTAPETTDGYHSPFGQELAPSAVRADEPGSARLVGMVGLCATFAGVLIVLLNWIMGPRVLPMSASTWFFIVGVAGLLFHAARDADVQMRRTYGAVGALLVILAIGFSFISFGEAVGSLFLPVSAPAFLLGLFFLLPFARHETDPVWRRNLVVGVTLVGAGLALAGLVGGSISGRFLLPYGAVAAVLGLLYLWAAVGLFGSAADLGYKLALAVGLLGGLAVVVALVRSAVGTRYLVPDGLVLTGLGLLYVLLSVGICSERQIVVLTRRDLSSYFYSPIAYLVLFGMSVICWFSYWLFVSELAQSGPSVPEPILRNYIVSLLPVFALMFVVPAITMRLLSEEQRTGTMEVLLTAPINEPTVVLSKFLSALLFLLVACLPLGLFLIPLRVEGGQPFDVLPLVSFSLALACSGAAFVAMGLFFSSLSRNQIVAAVLTFMGMIVLLGLYLMVSYRVLNPTMTTAARQFSFIHLWIDSLGGKLYVRDLVGQLSMAALWLFLTVKVLESRKWK